MRVTDTPFAFTPNAVGAYFSGPTSSTAVIISTRKYRRHWNIHRSTKQSSSEDRTATLEAGRGPKLAGVIVRVKGRNTFGQCNPREFRADVNVHVRR